MRGFLLAAALIAPVAGIARAQDALDARLQWKSALEASASELR